MKLLAEELIREGGERLGTRLYYAVNLSQLKSGKCNKRRRLQ